MRETRTSGSEGGGTLIRPPYPYPAAKRRGHALGFRSSSPPCPKDMGHPLVGVYFDNADTSTLVTRTISSTVVVPLSTLAQPSSRMSFRPLPKATF